MRSLVQIPGTPTSRKLNIGINKQVQLTAKTQSFIDLHWKTTVLIITCKTSVNLM